MSSDDVSDASPPRRPRGDKAAPASTRAATGTKRGPSLKAGLGKVEDLGKYSLQKSSQTRSSAQGNVEGKTVFRDREGRKVEEHDMGDSQKKGTYEWGAGLVQRRQMMLKRKREFDMSGKPFARYADDEELNNALRKTTRWGDPMASLLRAQENGKRLRGSAAYSGRPAPPNRYGILPGPRWDGKDRSNGFESRLFEMRSERELRKKNDQVKDMLGL